MKRALLALALLGCSDDFTRQVDSSPELVILPDTSDPPEDDAAPEATSQPDVLETSLPDASEAAPTCANDGGACSPGSCCNGLHCVSGACSSCKPKGYIATQASECCDPQSFGQGACGGGASSCGVPNQSGFCNNGMVTCCPGSTCKWLGQYWQCSCGSVDAPCTANGECCSNTCAAGWCK